MMPRSGFGISRGEVVVRAYQLHVKVEGAWEWVCTIDAPTHAEAFRQALICIGRDNQDRPIRLEQDTEGAFRKPCPHARQEQEDDS